VTHHDEGENGSVARRRPLPRSAPAVDAARRTLPRRAGLVERHRRPLQAIESAHGLLRA